MSLMDSLNRLLGDPNIKELKKLKPFVPKVRKWQHCGDYQKLTLADLPKKTEEFKKRIADGEKTDDLLPEAFGLVCRASELLKGKSVKLGKQELKWEFVPYDVQIIGGVAIHQGNISEMKTVKEKRSCVPCLCISILLRERGFMLLPSTTISLHVTLYG